MLSWLKRSVTIVTLCVVLLLGLLGTSVNAANLSPAPNSAAVYIISPKDGDTVSEDFIVQFGLSGMGIAPATVDVPNTGHHHLLIDMDRLPSLTKPLQASGQLLHYGAGQTETQLHLKPGTHTLQLVLGNYSHIPHDKPVISEKITVTVK